jgi:hypothetical protein
MLFGEDQKQAKMSPAIISLQTQSLLANTITHYTLTPG